MGDEAEDESTNHGPHRPLEEDVEVICPHCGEAVVIALDVSGGASQDYVQDCEVCCRPWRVQIHFAGGTPEVTVEEA